MLNNHDQLRFGDNFDIFLKEGQLRRAGLEIKLAPQPFQLLALLARRAGDLVTRDEIRAELWRDGTTVEFDLGVNYCIRQVRIALQDDPRDPKYIATVPKRGYRFLQPVSSVGRPAVAPPLLDLPRNPDALRPFREAEHLAMSWDLGSVQRATELYREVIRLDPGFANAYASLANALTLLPLMGGGQHNTDEAESLARTAISMDDSLSLAHLALAHVSFHRWKWKLAEAEFRRALESDPQNGSGHHLYAMFLVARGRFDEAIEHSRKAADLHPTTGVTLYGLAHVYFHARRYAEAIQQHIHTLNMVRHYPITYAALLRAYVMNGSLQEAGKLLDEWESVSGPAAPGPWRTYLLASRGQMAEAQSAFAAWTGRTPLQARNPMSTAIVQLAIGDDESALDTLQEAVRQRAAAAIWLNVAPELASIRTHPRYRELVLQMDAEDS